MSYILDALKRSERERGDPVAADTCSAAPAAASSRRTLLVLCACLFLLNGLALAGWAAWRWSSAPSGPATTVAPAPLPGEGDSGAHSELALAAAAGESKATTQKQPAHEKDGHTDPPSATDRAGETPKPKPRKPDHPPAKRGHVTKAAAPPPLLSTLPAAFQSAVSPLTVEVHVYADSPARRFVIIGGQGYHEGDQLSSGPKILRITETGVWLSYKGRRFRVGLQ